MLKRRGGWSIIALLSVSMLGLASCSNQRSASQPDDSAITTEIQARLFQDSVLKTRDIRVVSQDGAVVMTGTVGTELEKAAALRIAQKTPGVQQVIDQLTVGDISAATNSPTSAESAPAPTSIPQRSAPAPAARPIAREPSKVAAPRANRQVIQTSAPVEDATTTGDASLPPVVQTAATPSPAPPAPAPAPEPRSFTIPTGTVVRVQTIDRIDSSQHRPGDEFAAMVESPVTVGDRVVIPRNSDARLRLVEARSAGRMTGRSELQLELIGITVGGVSYPVQSGIYQQQGSSRGTRTAETVGGGAALGAIIGAIAGRGKGAAIGAAVGAGSGAAVQAVTHGEQVKVPPETKLEFTLRAPLTISK